MVKVVNTSDSHLRLPLIWMFSSAMIFSNSLRLIARKEVLQYYARLSRALLVIR